ncbi:MAG: hypothetical protein ACYDBB_06665 [Armatimonadota bacterium]
MSINHQRRRRPRVHRPLDYLTALSQAAGEPHEPGGATPMCVLTLIYHEDFEQHINRIIQREMLVARYTKIREVVGARTDTLEESDYEPSGSNHMLMLVAEHTVIQLLSQQLKELRQTEGHGLRGYITPVIDMI